jgi:hypothetical protein
LLALSLTGCGGGNKPTVTSAPKKPNTPFAASPVVSWTPTEHSEQALADAWAQEGLWKQDLTRLLKGRDPGGRKFLAHLKVLSGQDLKRQVLTGVLESWEQTGPVDLAPVIRAFPRLLASILPAILSSHPKRGLKLVERFLFVGSRRLKEAWLNRSLRAAVVRLCERPGLDLQQDLATGPLRARALRIASRAHLKEVIPALKKAAGLARNEKGVRLGMDPYGPAAALARSIIQKNRARQKKSQRRRRKGSRRGKPRR